MPLDVIMISALRRELEPGLLGARIDRISMPERDVLVLSVHCREEGNRRVLLSLRPGAGRLHYTQENLPNPAQPPMLCMLLRKHLQGGRVLALEQPEGERILILRVEAFDELRVRREKRLVLELMGKGLNLLLVGEDGRILDCLRRVEPDAGARRAQLPGLYYQLPPEQERPAFFRASGETLERLLREAERSGEAERWLRESFWDLSPLMCRELSSHGWEGLSAAMDTLRRRMAGEGLVPTMLFRDGVPADYSFQRLEQYGAETEQVAYPSFSELLDAFYTQRDRQESLRRKSAELTRAARTARERLLRKLSAREQELLATENREEHRRRGDLITANIYRLRRGMESFEAQDFYREDAPAVTVTLDSRKSPQENAADSYKLYAKAKTANRVLKELIAAAREEESYLDSVLDELARAESEQDLAEIRRELTEGGYLRADGKGKRAKQPPARQPLRFVSSTGREILVGRGNTDNDRLTFHIARRGDLWLHVQKIPGSHVIVSQAEGPADETTLRQAAVLAVTYSRARDAGRTAVDCAPVRNVKKPSGARPGQVIYTEYTTLIAQADPALAESLQAGEGRS